MWWHGGAGLTERSERGSLSAVATHDVFAWLRLFFIQRIFGVLDLNLRSRIRSRTMTRAETTMRIKCKTRRTPGIRGEIYVAPTQPTPQITIGRNGKTGMMLVPLRLSSLTPFASSSSARRPAGVIIASSHAIRMTGSSRACIVLLANVEALPTRPLWRPARFTGNFLPPETPRNKAADRGRSGASCSAIRFSGQFAF